MNIGRRHRAPIVPQGTEGPLPRRLGGVERRGRQCRRRRRRPTSTPPRPSEHQRRRSAARAPAPARRSRYDVLLPPNSPIASESSSNDPVFAYARASVSMKKNRLSSCGMRPTAGSDSSSPVTGLTKSSPKPNDDLAVAALPRASGWTPLAPSLSQSALHRRRGETAERRSSRWRSSPGTEGCRRRSSGSPKASRPRYGTQRIGPHAPIEIVGAVERLDDLRLHRARSTCR